MELINVIYNKLYRYYGPQNWWPGEGLEIAIGAVLTQQTNWNNVEKAISNLKKENCLNLDCLKRISIHRLENLIKSSGFYKVKAKRLKNLVNLFIKDLNPSREMLISVKGIGYETADSILLYQLEQPYFVIDEYTFRIMNRVGISEKRNYLQLQRIFIENIPTDIQIYQEFHALLVTHAKQRCKKTNPNCMNCPLRELCQYQLEKKGD